jgi:hypothetical protein
MAEVLRGPSWGQPSEGQGNHSNVSSCALHGICRDTANNSQGAVYQSYSPAPPTEMLVEMTAKTYMGIEQKELIPAM